MADGKKVLSGLATPLLTAGEELLGGCRSAGKGAVAKSAAAAGIAGAVGGTIDGMTGGKRSGGIASDVPQERIFWIGATNQRLLYFGVSAFSSKPKRFVGETSLQLVESVDVKKQMATRRLTFTFTDGSSASVDLYRASSPDSLQSALEAALPGKVNNA
ncbi:hypothetical protein [Flexivirga sp. B27]